MRAAMLLATVGTRVSPALALAVIAVESAGRADAVSSANAQGLMQLIPATADRFGVTDPFDGAQSIKGGVQYLDWLMDRFDNDVVLALAGYNAGEGAVARNGGVPPLPRPAPMCPRCWARGRSRGDCARPSRNCPATPACSRSIRPVAKGLIDDRGFGRGANIIFGHTSAHSTIFKPPSTTSSTPRLVMMRLTTPVAVSGRVQAFNSFDSPALLVWSITTITRLTPRQGPSRRPCP